MNEIDWAFVFLIIQSSAIVGLGAYGLIYFLFVWDEKEGAVWKNSKGK